MSLVLTLTVPLLFSFSPTTEEKTVVKFEYTNIIGKHVQGCKISPPPMRKEIRADATGDKREENIGGN